MSYTRTTRTTRTFGPGGSKTETHTTSYGGGESGGHDHSFGDDGGQSGGYTRRVVYSTDGHGDPHHQGGNPHHHQAGGHQQQRRGPQPIRTSMTKPRARVAPSPSAFAQRGWTGLQNYDEIIAKCRQTGEQWEDSEFPADDLTLFYSCAPPKKFDWKRPSEIVPPNMKPELFVGGASRFDVQQGILGDCWLLAAVASLSLHKELLHQVIPPHQDFSTGCIRFRFWQYGHWVDVLVDDRLPTFNGRLIYMHSADCNEFWSALLEKAYAKLTGCFENLKGGQTSEAMEDFTGGVTEIFNLRDKTPANMFSIMKKADERCSLMGCSIDTPPGGAIEGKLDNGLIMGHAYSLTGVRDVKTRKYGQVQLVRVRNPWGNSAEWLGPWSDNSNELKNLTASETKTLDISKDDDGEFWMSFQDFITQYSKLEICNLGPDSMSGEQGSLSGKSKRRWEACVESKAWVKRATAGGCRNNIDTFHTNPQIHVKVVDADEDDDEEMGTIIVGLMQKNMRKKRSEGGDVHTIGYAIYKVTDSEAAAPLDQHFFKTHASFAKSYTFVNMREICGRHKLPPGNYVIIPSTFDKDKPAEFILRIFSEKPNESAHLDEECGMTDVQPGGDGRKPKTHEELQQEQVLKELFNKVAGYDEAVDAYELRNILNTAYKKEFNFGGFSVECCRSMVALMDVDESGTLGCEEFITLWDYLKLWKTAFKQFDKDKSGNLSSSELRPCLRNIGYTISNDCLTSVILRYSKKDASIEFDDYVLLCCRLRTTFETIHAMMNKHTGQLDFNKDLFIKTCIYL
ncbi:calpain-9-like isoform X2 [Lineus longissimus]|uniref:calpain-9-like isoform X2 n=1 Tax=Lineus longissimus TaxID=88925 RepID=UPI002B4F2016